MCIIISKDKNIDRLPTIGELTNCFEYNRDGAGFMYVDKRRVIIEKGFMQLDDFITRFKELCAKYNDFKQKALVIHCRIGTSSGNTPENTHPYAITTKEKNLHKLYFETDLGVVHNGIISSYTPKDRGASVNDTQKFILEYLAPIHKHFKTAYKMEKFRDGIKDITNSKFVFLDKEERTYYVGDFVNENGLKFSNTTYKNTMTYYNKYSGWNWKKSNDYYYDDYYDDYEYTTKTETIEEEKERTFEFYDTKQNLIYLESGWSFTDNLNNYDEVDAIEFDLIYSLNTGALYYLNDLGYLCKYADFVTVYDEKFDEIY